jgi:hypothetical protein
VNDASWIRAVAPVVVIGILLGAVGATTGNPAMTMFLAIVAGVSVACSGSVVERANVRRAVLQAAVQGALLTVAVVQSGCVALPVPYVWIILFLATVSGALMGLILSALCGGAATAAGWLPLLLVPQVVFGGFLFPYYPTQPFAIDPAKGQVEVMPHALAPPAATSGPLQLAGAFVVSRWALEGYAALVYERDLADPAALAEAVKVNASVPVLFGDDVAHPLWLHVRAQTRGEPTTPPALRGGSRYYFAVLLGFPLAEAAALWAVLSARGSRRW